MRSLTISLFILILLGCAHGPGRKGKLSSITQNDANYYLSLAQSSAQPDKSTYLLKAGEILIHQQEYLKAQETLSYVKPAVLSELQKENYYLFYGHALQQLKQTQAALDFLDRIQRPEQHPIEWQLFYRRTLSEAFLNDGNYYEAARIRIEMEDLLLSPEEVAENHQFIWNTISQITPEFLAVYKNDFNDPKINGWLEIAQIVRRYQNHPDQLLAALDQWKLRYPGRIR